MLEVGNVELRNEAIKAVKAAVKKGNMYPQLFLKLNYPALNPEDTDFILKESGVIPNDRPQTITQLKTHIKKKKAKLDSLQQRFNEVRQSPNANPHLAFYELQSLAWQIDDLNIGIYELEAKLSSKYFGTGMIVSIVVAIVGALITIAMGKV